jgi:hypothetical protein
LHPAIVGLLLVAVTAGPALAQKWELPLVSRNGDTMYTDLTRIERVEPHIYRAWSRYVYAKPADNGTEALVQKEYDCKQVRRRVVSAVFYDADHAVTWESKEPGAWVPATRNQGRKQWNAVCGEHDPGVLANLMSWLKSKVSSLARRAHLR